MPRNDRVHSLVIDHDAQHVIYGTRSGQVAMLGRGRDEPLAEMDSPGGAVWSLARISQSNDLIIGSGGQSLFNNQIAANGDYALRVCRVPQRHQGAGGQGPNTPSASPSDDSHRLEVVQELTGAEGPTFDITVSPDGRFAASISSYPVGAADNTLRFWDLSSGTQLWSEKQDNAVWDLDFSPDGSHLAAAGREIIIRDARSGTIVQTVPFPVPATAVAYSPSGNRVICASHSGIASIWDVETNGQLHELVGHEDNQPIVPAVWISEELVATGGRDGTVRIWEAANGDLIRTLRRPTGTVEAIAISPSESLLASSGHGGLVQLWDRNSDRPIYEWDRISAHRTDALAFTIDGTHLIQGTNQGRISIWKRGESQPVLETEYVGGGIHAIAPLPNGEDIIIASGAIWVHGKGKVEIRGTQDYAIRILKLPKTITEKNFPPSRPSDEIQILRELVGAEGPTFNIAVSSDDRFAASVSGYPPELSDRTLRYWNLESGEQLWEAKLESPSNGVAISPDGSLVAVVAGFSKGILSQRRSQSGEELASLSPPKFGMLSAVEFSPDGNFLVTGGDTSHGIRVWSVPDLKMIRRIDADNGDWIRAIAFLGMSDRFASAGASSEFHIWALSTGEKSKSIKTEHKNIDTLAVASDGRVIATGGSGQIIQLWDLESASEIDRWNMPENIRIHTIVAAKEADYFFSGSRSGTVSLLKRGQDTPVTTMKSPGGVVWSLALTSKEKQLIIGSGGVPIEGGRIAANGDYTLKICRVPSQVRNYSKQTADASRVPPSTDSSNLKLVRELVGAEGPTDDVAVSLDGRFAASVSGFPFDLADKTLRYWNLKTGKQLWKRNLNALSRGVAISPDGRIVAASTMMEGRGIHLLDASTGEILTSESDHVVGNPGRIAFSPDGNTLVTVGDSDHGIRILNIPELTLIQNLSDESGRKINDLLILRDGSIFVTAGRDGTIRFWETETGVLQRTIKTRNHEIDCLCLDAEEALLASGGTGRDVHVWDLKSGEELDRWEIPAGNRTLCLAFTPDSRHLIRGDHLGNLSIWQRGTEAQSARTMNTGRCIFSLAILPNGNEFLTAGGDQFERGNWKKHGDYALKIWRLPELNETRETTTKTGMANAPSLALAPFSTEEARQHQQAWAEFLSVPVEREIDLGGGQSLTMVLIPPGEFPRGSSKEEQDRILSLLSDSDRDYIAAKTAGEGPRQQITISLPFWMSKHEVTVGQFRRFVEDSDYKTEAETDEHGGTSRVNSEWVRGKEYYWDNPGFEQGESYPVTNVSWNDAREFCQWLTGERQEAADLPTEAQWEYACRAGTTTAWYGTDDIEVAENMSWFVDGRKWTSQVGSFQANAFGLKDLESNLKEWCRDGYREDYYKLSPNIDPTGPIRKTLAKKAIRGGSWGSPVRDARSANRAGYAHYTRNILIGFRIVLEIDDL